MKIEVFQDLVCPWCYIGKQNLLKAIQAWGKPVTLVHRSFLLDPTIPKEGIGFLESMSQKMGNAEAVKQITERVTRAGAQVGISFRFDLVEQMPNTILSHRLIKSLPEDQQMTLSESIFEAYFTQGKDIGKKEVLTEIALSSGLAADQIQEAWGNEETVQAVTSELTRAKELGVSGVPFFVLNEKLGLSGAHPVENFLRAFAEAE
ncbi:DsbA family oxidoreductase [Risungbinella massiliensis]|uniref:DsbA family oxidoreductase n=1 Tax=Risungbinella massiliensis TaxID=1329796 RepID=UPI0005CC6469|nr:DsbA family oxidoreductase [Risungbinella massiliensis]